MMSNIAAKLNLRKDKGYAWCILVLSFFSHTVHTGFCFSVLGTVTLAHKALYGLDIQQSATIGAVQVGLFLFFAPVASVLIKKTSCRVTELIGGVSLMLGFGLSGLSQQIWHSYVLYSVVAAWGVSCCYMASSEILSLHFEKYKYLAFALVALGHFAGMALWPTASQSLFDIYGYHKAMGIMAGFHVLHLIAGVLYFEPENACPKEKEDTSHEIKGPQIAEEDELLNDATLSNTNSELSKCIHKPSNGQMPLSLTESFKFLLRSPKVWSLICNSFLWAFNVFSYLILVNEYMVSKLSISSDDAALGLTISGIGNLVGDLLTISVSRKKFDRISFHAGCSLAFGIFTMVMSASSNKAMFYALAALWGVAQGAHSGNLLAVVYEFCGAEQLPMLLGVTLFAQGISSLSAAPLCSIVANTIGSMIGMILSGCFGVMATVSLLPVIIHNYRYRLTSLNNLSQNEDIAGIRAKPEELPMTKESPAEL